VEGDTAFLILPAQSNDKLPWIWYAPTLPGLPGAEEVWMFDKFLQAGIAPVSMSVNLLVIFRVEHVIPPFTNICVRSIISPIKHHYWRGVEEG